MINHLDSRVEKSIIAPFYKNYYLNNQNKDAKKFVYIDIKTKNVNFISKNLNKAYTKFLYNHQTPDIFHFTYFNQKYYLKKTAAKTMTETVRNWRNYLPGIVPTPHPSWRTTAWLRKNPWFEADVVPELRERLANALNKS